MKNDLQSYGLIGHPLDHSFSKSFFEKKFERGNLKCSYKNYDLTSLDHLQDVVSENKLLGFNVTIPYKETVLNHLHSMEKEVHEIGAVNTVKVINNKLHGFNTDYLAFKNSLLSFLSVNVENALVLGNGGAAKAVSYALQQLGIGHKIVARNGKGHLTFDKVDSHILAEHKLIVNTTPLGTFPNIDGYPSLPYEELTKSHYLYDLVYNPEQTQFMKKGQKKGSKTCNGHTMLVNQAEMSWNIWNL